MKPKYNKGDILIKNSIKGPSNYVSPYDKPYKTKYTIRKVNHYKHEFERYTYSLEESHGFQYDSKLIDKLFNYDIKSNRLKKIKKINERRKGI